MNQRAFLLLYAALASGCATTGESGGMARESQAWDSQPAPVVVLDEVKSLEFFDSSTFDEDLSAALRSHYREVSVSMSSPFSINAIPQRMDKWLYKVKENGNEVVAMAVPPPNQVASRSLVGALIDVVVAAFDLANERTMFQPAEHYDVTMRYRSDNGLVQRVVFTHR